MKRSLQSASRQWRPVRALALLAGLTLSMAGAATLPSNSSVYFQTSGRERPATIGDWYTTNPTGGTASSSTTRFHRFDLTITQAQLDVAGGSVSLTVNDAESTAGTGPTDEVNGASDPTRFTLRSSGATSPSSGGSLLKQQTYASGSADGQTFTYSFTSPGTYVLFSETGGFPISGTTTAGLNDDDNGFTMTLSAGDVTPVLGEYQSTIQTSASSTFDAYFYVAPSVSGPLQLRNFDLDNGASVTYYRPDASSVTGTVSGNGVWNGSNPTINAGADSVAINSAYGWWRINISGLVSNNQTLFQANDGSGNRLPLVYVSPVALNLSKTVSTATPSDGDTVTYTVTVSNPTGGISTTGIQISDLLPSGLTYVGSTVTVPSNSTGSYAPTTGLWNIRNLSPGASATLSLQARVTARGTITNTATLSSVDQPYTPRSASVNLSAVNKAPVAANDSATTTAGTAVTLNVVSNDTDTSPGTVNAATVDLDPGTSGTQTSLTVSGQGTYAVNSSGVVTFTPATGFTGTSSIPYTVQDSDGTLSNRATITVTVNPRAALACSALYGLFGSDSTSNGLTINPLNETTNAIGSTLTTIPAATANATGYSATLGISPDGKLIYAARDSDRRLLKYDVTTDSWTTLGILTAGSTAARLVRMAVGPDGTGYAMDGSGSFYTFTANSTADISPVTLTRLPSTAPAFGGSGDFFSDSAGRLFLLSSTGSSSLDFWEINPSTLTAAYLGNISDPDIGSVTYGSFAATANGVYGRGGTNGHLIKVDLANLTVAAVGTDNSISTDLASCYYPNFNRTLTALKTATKVAGSSGTDIRAGDTVEYTITVANGGNIAIGGTRLQDDIPTGTAYVAGSTTLNGTAVSDINSAMPYTQADQYIKSSGQSDGVLLPNTDSATRSAVIKFRVTVSSGAKSISNQGTVTYIDGAVKTQKTDDPATAATPDATVTIVNTPPVAVDDSTSTGQNTAVTFSLIANDTDADGNGTINGASTVFATSGQPSGATLSNNNRTITVPNQGTYVLNDNGQVTFTPVNGYVGTTSAVKYTVQDTAGATSNTANITVTVTGADLSIVKTGPTYAKPGEQITYTLVVSNAGPQTANTLTVTDSLPSSVSYVSSAPAATVNGQTLTWSLASLASGGQQTYTVTVKAPSEATLASDNTARLLTNTATVSAATPDAVTANNTSSVTTQMVNAQLVKQVRNVTTNGDFSTTVTGLPGQILEYCIAAANTGGVALPNFNMSDNVPANVNALLTGYDADELSSATGFGVRLTRDGGAATYLTSAADADAGSLSNSGGTYSQGVMGVNLGTLAANGQAQACFRVTIR